MIPLSLIIFFIFIRTIRKCNFSIAMRDELPHINLSLIVAAIFIIYITDSFGKINNLNRRYILVCIEIYDCFFDF